MPRTGKTDVFYPRASGEHGRPGEKAKETPRLIIWTNRVPHE